VLIIVQLVDVYDGGGGGIIVDPEPDPLFNRNMFFSVANRWEGTRFDQDGGTRTAGGTTDCSGMVWGVYRDMGWAYPYCTSRGFANSPYWYEVSDPIDGDVVV
jgi:hypothetical protein